MHSTMHSTRLNILSNRVPDTHAPLLSVISAPSPQNFVVNAASAQFTDSPSGGQGQNATRVDGSDSSEQQAPILALMDRIDTAFTIIFTAELLVNIYAHWFERFWRDGWWPDISRNFFALNIYICLHACIEWSLWCCGRFRSLTSLMCRNVFDFLIITISLISLGPFKLPVNIIRLMRTFRVLRLFGRLKSLRQIFLALTASLIPVANTFFILFIIIAICEASTLFRDSVALPFRNSPSALTALKPPCLDPSRYKSS